LSYIWPSGATGATNYGYDPENHRVWVRTPDGGEDIHLYGLGGRLLAKLSHYEYVYLGSKLVYKKVPVVNGFGVNEINVLEDRVGSVGSYFPYGVERAASRENDVKFATYHRDTTGLDYANQRYYDSRVGRFLTPDPYIASGGPADPQSWNRYAYTRGDPVNRNDPSGLQDYMGPAAISSYEEVVDDTTWYLFMKYMGASEAQPLCVVHPEHPYCQSGGQDNGGTGSLPSAPEMLDASRQRLKNDLKKPDCAGLFTDVGDVLAKINDIGLTNQGVLKFHTENGKQVADRDSPGMAKYNSVTKSINLNLSVTWANPNNTVASLDGRSWMYPAADAEAALLGISSITSDQLMDIVVLHELSHYRGRLDPHATGSERTLWDNCIK
jgi:RHS repeat-associated protein